MALTDHLSKSDPQKMSLFQSLMDDYHSIRAQGLFPYAILEDGKFMCRATRFKEPFERFERLQAKAEARNKSGYVLLSKPEYHHFENGKLKTPGSGQRAPMFRLWL
ncbi:hypothetical protein HOA92_00245 [archaeon]|jgi:hypothetical protein|nr:hypothetical protein [archaeon]MBT6761449.1 hypothetical protein [archaeon]